jgi:hypothetical protein
VRILMLVAFSDDEMDAFAVESTFHGTSPCPGRFISGAALTKN